MRLADAKPGETPYDSTGGVWLLTADGAFFLAGEGQPLAGNDSVDFPTAVLGSADDEFGPFTRLVPEETNDND